MSGGIRGSDAVGNFAKVVSDSASELRKAKSGSVQPVSVETIRYWLNVSLGAAVDGKSPENLQSWVAGNGRSGQGKPVESSAAAADILETIASAAKGKARELSAAKGGDTAPADPAQLRSWLDATIEGATADLASALGQSIVSSLGDMKPQEFVDGLKNWSSISDEQVRDIKAVLGEAFPQLGYYYSIDYRSDRGGSAIENGAITIDASPNGKFVLDLSSGELSRKTGN